MNRKLESYTAFTLIELLVAMTLMVVTAACLYTALYTAFRAKRSASLAVEPTALAINAIELIKQDIYGVLPLGGTLAGTFVGTDAKGLSGSDMDSLEFYTTHIYYADDDQPAGGAGKIELVLEQNTHADAYARDSYELIRKVTTNLLSPKTVDAEQQVLCRNVRSLNFRYYDTENGWVNKWDSTADANSLPTAVEIDIQVLQDATIGAEESQTRRLVQSFPIPCGGTKQAESQSNNIATAAGGG
jgi:type II secretory pathway pseudopilin PulG